MNVLPTSTLKRNRLLPRAAHAATRIFIGGTSLLFLSAGITASPPDNAAGRTDPPPTLRTLAERAYERHPDLQVLVARSAEAEALAKRADSLIAGSPSLEAIHLNDGATGNDGQREWDAGVQLPLWRPGERDAARRLARSSDAALVQSEAALRLLVAGQVRETVWEMARMRNNLDLARKEWETAKALEQDVARRVQLGEMARTDLMLAQDETLRQRSEHLRAESDFDRALEEYRALTGFDQPPRHTDEEPGVQTNIGNDHPLLAQSMAEVERGHSRVQAVRREGGGSPELWLGAHRERGERGEDYNHSLVLALKVPIGTSAHTGVQVAGAERELTEAIAELNTLRRSLAVRLSEARIALQATRAELKIAEQQNQLAKESLRLARVAFSVGETDLVGLLRIQARAFAAARAEQELRINRQRAIARYNQALGILP